MIIASPSNKKPTPEGVGWSELKIAMPLKPTPLYRNRRYHRNRNVNELAYGNDIYCEYTPTCFRNANN